MSPCWIEFHKCLNVYFSSSIPIGCKTHFCQLNCCTITFERGPKMGHWLFVFRILKKGYTWNVLYNFLDMNSILTKLILYHWHCLELHVGRIIILFLSLLMTCTAFKGAGRGKTDIANIQHFEQWSVTIGKPRNMPFCAL